MAFVGNPVNRAGAPTGPPGGLIARPAAAPPERQVPEPICARPALMLLKRAALMLTLPLRQPARAHPHKPPTIAAPAAKASPVPQTYPGA